MEYYRELLAPIVRGRDVMLAGMPLAGFTGQVAALRELGARRFLLIANGLGTGPLPDEDDAERFLFDEPAPDHMAEFRWWERLLADPPARLRQAIERFDPDRTAIPMLAVFNASTDVAGRSFYGARRPEWVALEDKTIIDAFWDRVGVARPPSEIVAPDRAELAAAVRRLDRGLGTVWAGDAREGFNGGATMVRWIREGDGSETAAFFAAHCDRVRVAPFVEGIPCSIHGLVFSDAVAVLRPVELVTLRPTAGTSLRYGGAATFWDSADDDRAAMRAAARRVGHALRDQVDFRGGFTVDGIMSIDGFLPTELNPRPGAGHGILGRSLPDLPFELLHRAAVEGEDLDFRPAELEALVVQAADARRQGGGWLITDRPSTATESHRLAGGPGGYREAGDGEPADATLELGPGPVGGFVRFTLDNVRNPPGPSVAPAAVAAFDLADRRFHADIGPLEAARPVR